MIAYIKVVRTMMSVTTLTVMLFRVNKNTMRPAKNRKRDR